jgi:hypothetical protein
MSPKPISSLLSSSPYGSWWNGRRAYGVLSGVLIAGIAVFFCFTLRDGHGWDGDYALYIMNAQNIISGTRYGDTKYIYNPRNPIHPASYPPGLPLLLVPVYLCSGIDLQQMKMVGVSTFILLQLLFTYIARQFLPVGIALAVTAVVGLHPVFWHFKDTIYSDLPFAFFCYAVLYLIDSLHQPHSMARCWSIFGAAVALVSAYLTRTVGVILFPTIVVISFYKSRKLITSGTLCIVLAAFIVILGKVLFPNDVGAYVAYFKGFDLLAALQQNAAGFIEAMRHLIISNVFDGARLGPYRLNAAGAVVIFLLLVLLGWITRVRVRFSVYELFLLAYGLMFLAFPVTRYISEFTRYSLPMWPLLILYAFYGAYTASGLLGRVTQIILLVLIFTGVCSVFALQYRKTDFGPIPYSVTDPASRELFDIVKTALPTDAVLLAWKPTIIALFTDRRSTI